MKKLFNIFFVFTIVNVVFITSCRESDNGDDPVPATEFELLTEHLVATGMDLDHVIKSANDNKFVAFPADASAADSKYVIDIRSAADFANGHVAGAVNVPITGLLDEAANAGGKQIWIACYSGQTACFATALLRMYGYPETQALKWGMSGWNSATDIWSNKVGNSGTGKLTSDAAPALQSYASPTLSTGATSGDAILKARVEAVIKEWGNATVSSADVVANPANYFVNNYFSTEHYTGFGHIEGAARINPLKIADGSISNLDPTKPVVTYCYTGQTSAVITAFLRVLGYDAKSMLFGMNGLNHSNDFWTTGGVTNRWGVDSNPKEHPLTN